MIVLQPVVIFVRCRSEPLVSSGSRAPRRGGNRSSETNYTVVLVVVVRHCSLEVVESVALYFVIHSITWSIHNLTMISLKPSRHCALLVLPIS